MSKSHLLLLLLIFIFLYINIVNTINYDYSLNNKKITTKLNHNNNNNTKNNKAQIDINTINKNKIEHISNIFKKSLNNFKHKNKKIDIIFLIDSSSSVGKSNFLSEIKFVKKILSDFIVSYNHTRVGIVTFSSQGKIIRHIDQISNSKEENDKCMLLNYEVPRIKFTGGGTYTFGAFREAKDIFSKARKNSKKVIFLITDGYSNGRNPVTIAKQLKNDNVTIFTIGIRTGNYDELFNIASSPGDEYSFLLESFVQFENLARRALHVDFKSVKNIVVKDQSLCNIKCVERKNVKSLGNTTVCCDVNAECACGTLSGHYSCICHPGYYGSGIVDACQLCPNGTYWENGICRPCPDINHITLTAPAINSSFCVCKTGFKTGESNRCEVITCPQLSPPEKGYFVKHPTGCGHVLNTACGARCVSGYQLVGSSIRLCQSNGTWSGSETSCVLKTCPSLPIPYYGLAICRNADLNIMYDFTPRNESFLAHYDDELLRVTGPMPIDTDCAFKCGPGFYMVGSMNRNCLPLSKWDGLQTTCKQILCPSLPVIPFGEYDPTDCHEQKSAHGSNCTVTCLPGFELKGPSTKTCNGKRNGIWTHKNKTPKCIDIAPPDIKCPNDYDIQLEDNDNFAVVTELRLPEVSDNSQQNVTFWSKPFIKDSIKLEMGKHEFSYIAVDSFKNKAKCNFTINVIDRTPPVLDNCIDPPDFFIRLSQIHDNNNYIEWDDPIVYDNSNTELNITQSLEPGFLKLGKYQVKYIATDLSNNTNECLMNITVKELKCERLESPINGTSLCAQNITHMWCDIKCNYGNAIYDEFEEDFLTNITLLCEHDFPKWKYDIIPECSTMELPLNVEELFTINLDSDKNICDDSSLQNEIERELRMNVREQLCGDQDECEIVSKIPLCTNNEDNINNTLIDNDKSLYHLVKRDLMVNNGSDVKITKIKNRRKMRANIKINIFTKIAKKLGLWRYNGTRSDNIKKLKVELRQLHINEKLKKKFDELKIDMQQLKIDEFIRCPHGSILRKFMCVHCPRGTYHNVTTNTCQGCHYGMFNNMTGQIECSKCPSHYSTRRMHSKSESDCRQQCPPGTMARIKIPKRYRPKIQKSLMPFCRKCSPGEYQPLYDQTKCELCPNDFISPRGSRLQSDCTQKHIDPCSLMPPICGKNGECVSDKRNDYYYNCICNNGYLGGHCEIEFNLCSSSPCMNGGLCKQVNSTSYVCECNIPFIGDNCDNVFDPCNSDTCLNNGTCIELNGKPICECGQGFDGDFCELQINYCLDNPCEIGDCVNTPNGYHCQCPPGFIGRRCNLRPCDYQPCSDYAICIDLPDFPATRDSYKCQCPPGFKGADCYELDNPCDYNPCKNNGACQPLALRDITNINDYDMTNESIYNEFICQCPPYFYGKTCEILTTPDFILDFERSSIADYVELNGPTRNLYELSFCSWIQSNDSFNYGTLLSYATAKFDNAFTLTDYNSFVLYINGQHIITDITMNDGLWHFICISWMADNGFYEMYVDGSLYQTGYNLSLDTPIENNGKFIIGQEQDEVGSSFSESESFVGKLAYLDIWDVFLTSQTVQDYYITCEPYQGNLISWSDVKYNIRGNLKIEQSDFCKPCTNNITLLNGFITIIDNKAYYECNEGYLLHGIHVRNCLRTSQWELPVPYCKLIRCGYIVSIPNGKISVTKSSFGGRAWFMCNEGYYLNGSNSRVCLTSGNWSGENPECISNMKCNRIDVNDNYIINYATERGQLKDDLEKYPIGTIGEVQCLYNKQIIGDNILTCLETGQWDIILPTCINNDNINTNNSGINSNEQLKIIYRTIDNINITNLLKNINNNKNVPDKEFWLNFKLYLYYGCNDYDIDNNFIIFCKLYKKQEFLSLKYQLYDINIKTDLSKNLENLLKLALLSNNYNWNNINLENIFNFILYANINPLNKTININMENKLRYLICLYIEDIINDITSHSKKGNTTITNYNTMNTNENIKLLLKLIIIPVYDNHIIKIHNILNNDNINNYLIDKEIITTELPMEIELSVPVTVRTTTLPPEITTVIIGTTTTSTEVPTIELNIINCKVIEIPLPPINSYIFNLINENNLTINIDEIKNNLFFNISTQIKYNCNKGYKMLNDCTTTCNKYGKWNLINCNCEKVTCEQPPRSVNMQLASKHDAPDDTIVEYKFGDKVQFQCKNGFNLNGNPYSSCLSTGKWSKIFARCSRISCNKPKLPSDATIITGKSYLYQDKLKIMCNNLLINEIECQSNGQWLPKDICG